MAPRGNFWVRWRVRLGYPVGLAAYLLARPTRASILLGAMIAACGLVLRGAAAGQLRKGEQLAASGPYAYTRNPLYLGSALLATGFALASRRVLAAVLVAAYFVPLYWAVMQREERDLHAAYGAAFEDYAARVPRFWPQLKRTGAPGETFSWTLYRRNREYEAALGFVFAVGLLWLRMYWPR